MGWVATAVIGSSIIGAGASIYGADKAADAQTQAAAQAAAVQKAMYEQTRRDLSPYRDIGGIGVKDLTGRLKELTSPIMMDQATLENTPGYQWNLAQGLKAAQNSAAARGLGTSGAALKGAATFATGLADSTYQNQFNNAVTNQTNAFNRLKSLVDTGQNAAAQTGSAGSTAAKGQADAYIGAGDAQAAAANKTAAAVGGAANNIGGYYAANPPSYKGLYGAAPTKGYGGLPAIY